MAYEQALAALADPTRRQVFDLVRKHNFTVGELAAGLNITQPAVSQHLRVLRSANLVIDRREGARRYYRPNPAGLAELRRYVESLWDDALEAFAAGDPGPRKEEPTP
ncbi:MAG TPA: metalloregulator ArsR/SmtB family transcription factor [Pyrinomonadaceae bacterium]|nr:metalloregulator ArsR/SmtB family transcription factor [Pyrinomonadaceae bacterium]